MSSFALTLFCLIIGVFLSQGRNIPEDDLLSINDLQEYSRDASRIREFDIISPQYATTNGVFKRSTESTESQPQRIQEVQYEAFNTIYSLRLERNDWLVRKGLQTEIIRSDGTIGTRPLHTGECFHYFGSLAQYENSAAAISLCNGMYGLVSHNGTDYIIQPLKDHHASKVRTRRDVERPHIIYKRSFSKSTGDSDERVERRQQPVCLDEGDAASYTTVPPIEQLTSPPKQLPHVGQKYLEVLIVADKSTFDFYGNNTVPYVFSLMNIVSRMFADSSLDVTLRIHVVKFIIFDIDPTSGGYFNITGSPRTLTDFCIWQASINPIDDTHPEHWDNAVLITRKDLYSVVGKVRKYSTQGDAYTGGTCTSKLQCSSNQDEGLGTAEVIAHEIGHTLGLSHDGDAGCEDGRHIMSTSWFTTGLDTFTWSECSRRDIRMFLRRPKAVCLDDLPSSSPLSVHGLVGLTLDLKKQCEVTMGPESKPCQTPSEINCEYLDCRNASGCYRFSSGVMDGTVCGEGKWCLSGSCVPIEALPNATDGGWSEWKQNHGECSRTCGGGVRMRVRYCDNPKPQHGGLSCEGPATGFYEACNLQPCAKSQNDFRDEQCSQTNSIPHSRQIYTWKAFVSTKRGDDLCLKICLSNDSFIAIRPPYRYVDGTRCWHGDDSDTDTLKMCVFGKCEKFGCDGIHESDSVFDVCRQCNGNGTSCEQISGFFDGGKHMEHTTFLRLPVGATSINITNSNAGGSFFGVEFNGSDIFQKYLSKYPLPGTYSAGGNVVTYSSNVAVDEISINGPLTVPLSVSVYLLKNPYQFLGSLYLPTIIYTYYVPKEQPAHECISRQCGECDVSCGDDGQAGERRCTSVENNEQEEVNETNCDPEAHPPNGVPCDRGVSPPSAEWVKSSWSECNVECGEGEQTRQVECQRGDVLSPGECSEDRPRDRRRCDAGECPDPDWSAGEWSECSVTCGNGYQMRAVDCRQGNVVTPNACRISSKPTVIQSCSMGACPEWTVGGWGQCDVSCGTGTQSRTVECRRKGELAEGACEGLPVPVATQECDAGECKESAEWMAGEWSECNIDCGFGSKYRSLTCRRDGVDVPSSECVGKAKPRTKAICKRQSCNVPARWSAGPWSQCSATCGEGTETRNVSCERSGDQVTSMNCARDLKPNKQRTCTLDPCPSPSEWVVDDWSECDSSCGPGVQRRSVTCQQNGRRTDGACPSLEKPSVEQSCDSGPCPSGAEVNSENEVCNQLLTVPAGTYSKSHPTGDSECTTTLAAPFGKSFTVTINSFIDCSQGEYLKIKEGTTEKRVCGNKSDYVLSFTDNVISIVLKTVSEDSGYALSFDRKEGRPSNHCDFLFLNPSGIIQSPGYPRRYPSDVDCRYRIVTMPGRQINLSFSRLSMQGHYPTCRYDKLEITDIFGQTKHKYCGTRNRFSIVSTGNDVLIRLRTDSRTNFNGFRATYSIR